MSLSNQIVLRPRFKIELDRDKQEILNAFDLQKNTQDSIVITRIEDHIFLKIPKEKQHFWSPQLDLEILRLEDNKCTVHGLFGPKPAVWTLFMFLHFVVVTLLLGCVIWAYTRASLNEPYAVQLVIMGLLVVAWFLLYFGGRIGKATGTDEMHELYNFMQQSLKI